MGKSKRFFLCRECGAHQLKWTGQCPDCGAWDTLEETQEASNAPPSRGGGYAGIAAGKVLRLDQVTLNDESLRPTGIGELDRVLGGGLVAGSVVLIGGDPGIGKSTLLLQVTHQLSSSMKCLYVSGEESPSQIGLRAERLGLDRSHLYLLSETQIEKILATAEHEQPAMLVIDSIQTLFSEQLSAAPGSVSQLRESAAQLVRFAKQHQTAVMIIGHVTKEGAIAGPRVLEHMVDTVLYFEGESGSRFRMLRAVKNRFGAVNELGVFAMVGDGLREISNPSAIFLSRPEFEQSGSVVLAAWEGSRTILVEVQALVDQSFGGYPKRVALGLDQNRLSMLITVLHRHAGVHMADQDVYVNIVGGLQVRETAADLAVILAAYSGFRRSIIPADVVVFGEIGLAGELRPISNGEARIKAARKHGFSRAILPIANRIPNPDGMELFPVRHVGEALETLHSLMENS